jgi:hypothetical protein
MLGLSGSNLSNSAISMISQKVGIDPGIVSAIQRGDVQAISGMLGISDPRTILQDILRQMPGDYASAIEALRGGPESWLQFLMGNMPGVFSGGLFDQGGSAGATEQGAPEVGVGRGFTDPYVQRAASEMTSSLTRSDNYQATSARNPEGAAAGQLAERAMLVAPIAARARDDNDYAYLVITTSPKLGLLQSSRQSALTSMKLLEEQSVSTYLAAQRLAAEAAAASARAGSTRR